MAKVDRRDLHIKQSIAPFPASMTRETQNEAVAALSAFAFSNMRLLEKAYNELLSATQRPMEDNCLFLYMVRVPGVGFKFRVTALQGYCMKDFKSIVGHCLLSEQDVYLD